MLKCLPIIFRKKNKQRVCLLGLWVLTFLNVWHSETMIIFECSLEWKERLGIAWRTGPGAPASLGTERINFFQNPALSSLAGNLWLSLLFREIWVHSQEGLEEHGIRHIDSKNRILSLCPLTFCGFQIQLARFDHCTSIRDPICLNCVSPLPTKALTLLLLSRSLSPEEYLFQIIVPQMFWVLLLQSEPHLAISCLYSWSQAAFVLLCYIHWNLQHLPFCIVHTFCSIHYICLSMISKKTVIWESEVPDLFPEMMLCGFRLAICLLWIWSVDWGDHFLGSPSENIPWEGGSHNDEPWAFKRYSREN